MTKATFCSDPFICLYSEFNFQFWEFSALGCMAFEVRIEEKKSRFISISIWFHLHFCPDFVPCAFWSKNESWKTMDINQTDVSQMVWLKARNWRVPWNILWILITFTLFLLANKSFRSKWKFQLCMFTDYSSLEEHLIGQLICREGYSSAVIAPICSWSVI